MAGVEELERRVARLVVEVGELEAQRDRHRARVAELEAERAELDAARWMAEETAARQGRVQATVRMHARFALELLDAGDVEGVRERLEAADRVDRVEWPGIPAAVACAALARIV